MSLHGATASEIAALQDLDRIQQHMLALADVLLCASDSEKLAQLTDALPLEKLRQSLTAHPEQMGPPTGEIDLF